MVVVHTWMGRCERVEIDEKSEKRMKKREKNDSIRTKNTHKEKENFRLM